MPKNDQRSRQLTAKLASLCAKLRRKRTFTPASRSAVTQENCFLFTPF